MDKGYIQISTKEVEMRPDYAAWGIHEREGWWDPRTDEHHWGPWTFHAFPPLQWDSPAPRLSFWQKIRAFLR